MKKNLILFFVFITLLIGTYFFQELRTHKNYEESLSADRLVVGDVTKLKLPAISAQKRGDSWWSENQLLSHNHFKIIERKLTEIKKIKEIEGNWATFFSQPFLFEINQEKWAIGDMALDRQAFYISHNEKIYLAVIEGESVQLTEDPQKIAEIKVNELISALSAPKEILLEKQLFRFYPGMLFQKVLVTADGSLPYELDFDLNATLPPPILGVNVFKDLKGKFYSLLTQVLLREEIPYSEDLKYKKMAEIKFLDKKSDVTWELWLRSKTSADAVIIDSRSKRSFLMNGGSLRVFFIQLQDFWDKKVIPQNEFVSFKRLPMTFIQGAKKAQLFVLNREPMGFEVKGFKVEQGRIEQLIQILFNLGGRDQAERVSLLSKTEKMQLLSQDPLRVEVMGQELALWRKTEELIVVNLTQGFKAHFNLVDENFHGSFEDVLK